MTGGLRELALFPVRAAFILAILYYGGPYGFALLLLAYMRLWEPA